MSMTWPDHSYDGLTNLNTNPFADFEMDDNGGSTIEEDVDECVEDNDFDDIDWL